jgi:DMSO/TMAO reductase YedYZ molybdopterin-dependent catalytic subunit
MRDEMLLAYEINGPAASSAARLPAPLIVPGWYGMTHVKWLRSIAAVAEPFTGWQQDVAYHVRESEDEQGEPGHAHQAALADGAAGDPGVLLADALCPAGAVRREGRAWSGRAPISRVEFSDDGGETGRTRASASRVASSPGAVELRVGSTPGEHELCCRATDEAAASSRSRPSGTGTASATTRCSA